MAKTNKTREAILHSNANPTIYDDYRVIYKLNGAKTLQLFVISHCAYQSNNWHISMSHSNYRQYDGWLNDNDSWVL